MKKTFPKVSDNTARVLSTHTPEEASDSLHITKLEHQARKDHSVPLQRESDRLFLEKKFEAAFHANPDPIVISQIKDGLIVDVNSAFEKWSGYSREELLGKSTLELGLWVDPLQRVALLNDLMKVTPVTERTVDIRIHSGETRRLSCSASIFAAQGRQYLLTLGHDVTDRERVEQDLKLSNSRLEALQKLNQTTYASLGEICTLALEECVTLTQSKIGYVAFVNEDESILTMQAWSRSAMTECAVQNRTTVYPVETTGLWGEPIRQRRPVVTNDYAAGNPHKKGLPYGHLELTRHLNVPVFDGQKIVIVVGVGNKERDYDESDIRQLSLMMNEVWRIMQRNKTQDSLRSRQTLLDNILQSTADGILIIGPAGEILATNRRFQELWRIPDDILTPCDDRRLITHVLGQLADPEAFLSEVARIYQTEEDSWNTIEFKDGRTFERYSRAIPQYGKGSRLWSFRDITERIRAEEALRQAQKMDSVGQLAGGIAHDFNNMLGGIMGVAELLKERIPPDYNSNHLIQMLLDSSTRAAELTQQLLMFSRKTPLKLAPVNVQSAILSAVQILERTLDKRIRITCDFTPERAIVLADVTRLENSFLNLGLNARDAMPEGGDLRFTTQLIELDEHSCREAGLTTAPGQYLQISIVDTGIGIHQEDLGRIFDPFFTTKPVGKGTGLGLSVVYGIVKEHKGAIHAFSEVGRGSEFRMYLPTVSEQPAVDSPEEGRPVIPSGRTILLVEDEAVMRKVTQAILEKAGLKVLIATDGQEAVELYKRLYTQIDLVLLDMMLPGMNGRDAFLAMKALNPDIRAIFASGYTREGSISDLLEEGSVRGFLQKPFRRSALIELLSQALTEPCAV